MFCVGSMEMFATYHRSGLSLLCILGYAEGLLNECAFNTCVCVCVCVYGVPFGSKLSRQSLFHLYMGQSHLLTGTVPLISETVSLTSVTVPVNKWDCPMYKWDRLCLDSFDPNGTPYVCVCVCVCVLQRQRTEEPMHSGTSL